MINPDQIKTILRTIIDPELGYNIVDLGLIYNITVSPSSTSHQPLVTILMTLTTPGCPLAPYFVDTIKSTVAQAADVEIDQIQLDFTFDPPWSLEAVSEDIRDSFGL
jgi:metal-sulfur cluster biosynthetic enzyme